MVDIYISQEEEIIAEEVVISREPEISRNPEEPHNKRNPNSPFSNYMEDFLDEYENRLRSELDKGEQKFRVSNVLGKVATLYEKVRTAVEYKGEQVLRRNAIERIFRRLIWEKESIRNNVDAEKIALNLMKELIWARYIPNNVIPRSKVQNLINVVAKYLYILENVENLPENFSIHKFREWIWGIASAEIEDLLDPSNRDLYIKLMYNWFLEHFEWISTDISDDDKILQVYLAIHRALPKSDDSIMRYHLLLRNYPDWTNATVADIQNFLINFPDIYEQIEKDLNFPGRYDLYRKIAKNTAPFEIFHHIATEEKMNLRKLLSSRVKFENEVNQFCEKLYKQVSKRVSTGIIRSIIYIFLTKVALALLIEVPYEIILLGDLRFTPLTINIIFPPFMMWLIGFSIKAPGVKNTQTIISRLDTVAYKTNKTTRQKFSITQVKSSSGLIKAFTLVYSSLFILVFGGFSYLLLKLNFTIVAILIFFFFLSLVMLFAFRIRYNANQLKVETEDEGFLSHILNYLTLPFLNLGFFLSRGLAKLNFLTIILDFLIETPFKSILEVIEEWTSFMRQKKEDVVEIPE